MQQIRFFQCGQSQRDADAIVRAQRRVLGHHPTITHHCVDGIALEIMLCSGIGLAHHVEMALQDHSRLLLATGAGGLSQNQIACCIHDGGDAACLRPLDQMLAQFRFMQR